MYIQSNCLSSCTCICPFASWQELPCCAARPGLWTCLPYSRGSRPSPQPRPRPHPTCRMTYHPSARWVYMYVWVCSGWAVGAMVLRARFHVSLPRAGLGTCADVRLMPHPDECTVRAVMHVRG